MENSKFIACDLAIVSEAVPEMPFNLYFVVNSSVLSTFANSNNSTDTIIRMASHFDVNRFESLNVLAFVPPYT